MSNIQRIVPDTMQAQLAAPARKSGQPHTARFENTREGFCPCCGGALALSTANGIDVHWCAADSLVMPIRDADPISSIL